MKREIIERMTEIVESTMKSFKSDFYEYDMKALENYEGAFIWQIAESHTRLIKCDVQIIIDELNTKEAAKYYYASRNSWGEACILYKCSGEKIYYYGGYGLDEVNREWALDCYRAHIDFALEEWVDDGNVLPTNFKVKVEFGDLTTRREFIKCVRYAREHNDDSLLACAKMFHNWRKVAHNHTVTIYKDAYSDKCFSFCEKHGDKYGIVGGLIFHGYDEYETNGSVQLTPTKGWAMHT